MSRWRALDRKQFAGLIASPGNNVRINSLLTVVLHD
jgi:hypothetical protein